MGGPHQAGGAEARGLWYVTSRSVPVSRLHNSSEMQWGENGRDVTFETHSQPVFEKGDKSSPFLEKNKTKKKKSVVEMGDCC